MYIGDTSNNVIRKVAASTGIISTIAGTGTAAYNSDGVYATSASLNKPVGVALDSAGNRLYPHSSVLSLTHTLKAMCIYATTAISVSAKSQLEPQNIPGTLSLR